MSATPGSGFGEKREAEKISRQRGGDTSSNVLSLKKVAVATSLFARLELS
jgi:hypothetical protein